MTYEQLKELVLAEAFPSGEAPENLSGFLNTAFQSALIEVQRWVRCYAFRHDDVYPSCSTFWNCGTTQITAPRGRILRVYSVQNRGTGSEWCCPVMYNPSTVPQVRRFQAKFRTGWRQTQYLPPSTEVELPLGFNVPNRHSDAVSGRAASGLWTIDPSSRRLIVAPWLQSYESLVVEWQGIKRAWLPTDELPSDPDFIRLLRLFIDLEYGRKWGCEDLQIRQDSYSEALADAMVTCEEETKTHGQPTSAEEVDQAFSCYCAGPVTLDEIYAALGPETSTVLALFGDFGTGDDNARKVAAAVHAMNPLTSSAGVQGGWIVTLGDNVYAPVTVQQAFAPYQDYVDNGRIRAVMGNHDFDAGDLGASVAAHVGNPGNGRYFVVRIGMIEFYVIDSGVNSQGLMVEPDGNYKGSNQYQEITAALIRSTARWKVAVLHHSPWTSGIRYAPGLAAVRWVSDLPVHMVIGAHSHNYERLLVRNRVHLVAGTGGHVPEGFVAAVTGSQVRIAELGFIKLTATCDELCWEFIGITPGLVPEIPSDTPTPEPETPMPPTPEPEPEPVDPTTLWIGEAVSRTGASTFAELEGTGTEVDPILVSTAEQFDEVLEQSLGGIVTTFRLKPGTFWTRGNWIHDNSTIFHNGHGHIIGSGMDQSTIKLDPSAVFESDGEPRTDINVLWMGPYMENAGNFSVTDLTIDGNMSAFGPDKKIGGLKIFGNAAQVLRVRVQGIRGIPKPSPDALEVFGILLNNGATQRPAWAGNSDGGSLIQDCVVEDVAPLAFVTGIYPGYIDHDRPILPTIVERCVVDLGNHNQTCFSANFQTVIRDCTGSGAVFGFYNDTDDVDTVTMMDCQFTKIRVGISIKTHNEPGHPPTTKKTNVSVTRSSFDMVNMLNAQGNPVEPIGAEIWDQELLEIPYSDFDINDCTYTAPADHPPVAISVATKISSAIKFTGNTLPDNSTQNIVEASPYFTPPGAVLIKDNWVGGILVPGDIS